MISIASYDDGWPVEFATIGANLRDVLGDGALRIDHIGSTAVPGLAAKDIIDVQITVAKLSESVSTAMESLGYVKANDIGRDHKPPGAGGPDSAWEKWFFYAPRDQRPTNTHVRVAGSANQRYALLFRDYLRSHQATAEAYAELKQRLAANLTEPMAYPDVKDPAVDLIYLAAKDWAESTGWTPGPSDA